MYITTLNAMTGGWFVGKFQPVAYHHEGAEVAWKEHQAGEDWPAHYQKQAWEINLLVKGRMKIGAQELKPRDIFVVPPMEVIKPVFLEDCLLVVVKSPSLPDDKVVVDGG